MKRIDQPESVKLHNTIVILGKFDGFHLGHQKLLQEAIRLKTEHAAASTEDPWHVVIFTFDIYPGRVLGTNHQGPFEIPEGNERNDERKDQELRQKVWTIQTRSERFLDDIPDDVDYLIEFPFNQKTMSMEPEQFVKNVLVDQMGVRRIVCGSDFRFGKDRKGSVQTLQELGEQFAFEVSVVPKVTIRFEDSEDAKAQEISSTLIKEEIQKGHMEHVTAMLGRPFCITGKVVKGKQLGRTIGFPTANQLVPDRKILPPDGVYATRIRIHDAENRAEYRDCEEPAWRGVTNLGRRPTVNDGEHRTVETFLFDFTGDLYDKEISVEFLHFLRPEQKFETVQKLQEQMQIDMVNAKNC